MEVIVQIMEPHTYLSHSIGQERGKWKIKIQIKDDFGAKNKYKWQRIPDYATER